MGMGDTDVAMYAEVRRPSQAQHEDLQEKEDVKASHQSFDGSDADSLDQEPTDEEIATLRRVSGKIPFRSFTVTFVELCERFSYYGTTAVFVNFVQRPLPPGSTTGAAGTDGQAGALGQGQQASTGLSTFNQFWSYVMPLVGGFIADQYLGRYATIQWSILFALIGHVILIVSALPPVIADEKGALGCFAVGLVIMGIGTGGFKSNIAPLLAEQIDEKRMKVVTLSTGERVIVDPEVTYSRVYLWFYFMINVGSLAGGIGMVYAEKYVGFWLAYLLPTILFLFCPAVLFIYKKKYVKLPPTGSVLGKAMRLVWLASKGRWSANPVTTYRNFTDPSFWESIKPSKMESRPAWMEAIDDAWVDQVRRGMSACKVFLWYPLYWLTYNQIVNNLTSQSATMKLNGVPNDVVNNLNPLTLVIFIPIMDKFVYPALRKAGIHFTPIKRITLGFFLGGSAMISATVTQYYIYKTHPCGDHPNDCATPEGPISVWVQTVPYCLVAFSEIFASITGLEYAFTKAPENMRSLVQGFFLFQSALAAAIGQAFLPLIVDPLLTWNYGIVAVLAFIGGVGFWFTWRSLDRREDELNMLQASAFQGRSPDAVEPDGTVAERGEAEEVQLPHGKI